MKAVLLECGCPGALKGHNLEARAAFLTPGETLWLEEPFPACTWGRSACAGSSCLTQGMLVLTLRHPPARPPLPAGGNTPSPATPEPVGAAARGSLLSETELQWPSGMPICSCRNSDKSHRLFIKPSEAAITGLLSLSF